MHWILLAAVTAGAPLAAQEQAAASAALELADTVRLRRHVERLANDTMIPRHTPSAALNAAARYVADEFRTLGLQPGGDTVAGDTSWIQRYEIPGDLQVDYTAAWLTMQVNPLPAQLTPGGGQRPPATMASLDFSNALRPASRAFRIARPWLHASQAVLVAGRHTPASIRKADLRGRIVLHVPSSGADAKTQQAVIDELLALHGGLVIVADEDSVTFDQRRRAALQLPVRLIERFLVESIDTVGWAVYARADAMKDALSDAGVDLGRVRAATGQIITALPAIARIEFMARGTIDSARVRTAPNVVGMIEGTDPKLRNEMVIIAARLDHADTGLGAGDSGVGIAGLIELARAFSHPAARPKRPLIFIATSGSAADQLWGATYFLESRLRRRGWQGASSISLDLAGRHATDVVAVDGLADLSFDVRPDWIAAKHPELGLTVVDGGTVTQRGSSHFAFVRKGIPGLFIHSPSDSQDDNGVRADAVSGARVVDLVFHVARDIANARQPLKWTAEGRRRYLGAIGE